MFQLKSNNENDQLVDPTTDLFIWAVMCNKPNVAVSLWSHSEGALVKALIGRVMYKRMAESYKLDHPCFDEEIFNNLKDNSS